jgi:chromosome segregation ATPase
MLKQLLNKTENYGQPTELPKQFKMYLPFKEPVEKAKEDKFNKNRTKQYWSAGDFLFPNLNKEKYSQQELEENLLRSVIRESVDKELASINKEAEHEALQNKLEKIEALIDKKQSQLTRLDEDEDMKDLTDKKKVKQIEKDIKTLEKAKAKVEKMMSKGKKKEVIGETEDEMADDAPEDFKAAIDNAEQLYDELGNLEDTLAQIPDQYKKEVERHLKGAYGL